MGRSVERAIGGSGPGTVERGDRAIEIRRVAEELEPLNEPGSQIPQSGRVSRDELGGPVFSRIKAPPAAARPRSARALLPPARARPAGLPRAGHDPQNVAGSLPGFDFHNLICASNAWACWCSPSARRSAARLLAAMRVSGWSSPRTRR